MPKRILQGKVVSESSDKTIVVRVVRQVSHKMYKKIVRVSSKYIAHDENNTAKVGDVVKIEESRPYSKRKRWKLLEASE